MDGLNNGNFIPSQELNRAEVATIIAKLFSLPLASKERIFSDVKSYDKNITAINALYKNKITSGCSANPLMFCPYKKITRAELTSFLVRAMKLTNSTKITRFSDVATNFWNYNDIQKISSQKTQIIPNCDNKNHNKFCPNQVVTRGEMAQIAANVL